jgi:hypothetical protein
LFNRQLLNFIVKDKIEQIPLSQMDYALQHKFIDANTLYFNNIVLTKTQLIENWITPLKNTWLKKYLQKEVI